MVAMKWLFSWVQLRWLTPGLLVLIFALAASRVEAGSRSETNALNELRNLAAEDAKSKTAWAVVEAKCENFLQRYASSEHVPDVQGIEAQAMFRQQKFDAVISKFSTPSLNTNRVADQFAYWLARSYFEQKNFSAAADNFARLARDYVASPLRLEAIYRECEAYARLEQWQRVIEELRESNGAFQQFARSNP